MEINNKIKTLKEDEVCVIPSNVTHAGKAITDCELMMFLCPQERSIQTNKNDFLWTFRNLVNQSNK